MSTTLADVPQNIIQTHILPRLDARSLSTIATVSSSLRALCSDHNLWSHVSKCMWPSITHPRVNELISSFPGGHPSFFHDSFPSLITEVNHRNCSSFKQQDCSSSYLDSSTYPLPTQIISAVDIQYQTDVIYSAVQFTNTTTDFLSSELLIKLNEYHEINRHIDMEVDELAGVDEEALLHLKESLTLNWIVIYPTLKRAGNLSSIKPVSVKRDWMTNETLVQYVTVLPGCDPDEMVQCRIQVVLGVGSEGEGFHVKELVMKLLDSDSCCLNGRDFLVISQRVILEENDVRRKVVDDDERWKTRHVFKEMKRKRRELIRKEENKRERAITINYIGILVSFCFSVYFLSLMLQ